MAFGESVLPSIFPPGDQPEAGPTTGPILPQLPSAQRALVNKYSEIGPIVSQLPPTIGRSLLDFDVQRVQGGKRPLSVPSTAKVLKAALGQPTPEPERSPLDFFENLAHNATTLVSAIPRLLVPTPSNPIIKEIQSIPTELPKALQRAAQEDSPAKAIARVAGAPGIRLLPGAFVAEQLAAGTPSELARNPLFALLDVAPLGVGAARASRIGKLARQQTLDAVGRLGGRRAPLEGVGPVRAVLTRRLTPEGEVVPTRLGARTERFFTATRPGQTLAGAFGEFGREPSRLARQETRVLEDLIATEEGIPLSRISDPVRRDITRLTREAQVADLDFVKRFETRLGSRDAALERQAELTRALQDDPTGILTKLTDDTEIAYVATAKDLTHQFGRVKADAGLVAERGGEIFTVEQAKRLTNAERRVAQRRTAVASKYGDRLRRFGDPRVQPVIDAIEGGNLTAAWQTFTRLPQRLQTDLAARGFRDFRKDLRRGAATERSFGRLERSTVPARFIPGAQRRAAQEIGDRAIQRATSADEAADIHRAILERDFERIPGFDQEEFLRLSRGYGRRWQDLKAQGVEPTFVHHIGPDARMRLDHPRVTEALRTPSSIKERTFDMRPAVHNSFLALSDEGAGILSRQVADDFVHTIVNNFGHSRRALEERFLQIARSQPQRRPGLDVRARAEQLINREFTAYNAEDFVTLKSAKLGRALQGSEDQILIPRAVADTLRRLKPSEVPRLSGFIDPGLQAFRMSVVGLSPRTQLYNILGGAIMLGLRTDPSVFRYVNQARRMIRGEQRLDLPPELASQVGAFKAVQGAQAMTDYAAGRTLARWWEQSRRIPEPVRQAGGAVGRLTQKSIEVNAFVDDMYRAMGYLYGYDKALVKGLTKTQAVNQGLGISRKILQQWDSMTPIERTILRQVFPFYSFMSHVLRYSSSYAIDHPIRLSIMSQFARNELADLETGLPQTFLNSMFFGSPGPKGEQRALQLQGVNPFNDVANYFTLAGFLGAANPLIQTVAEQAGVDIFTGGPDLYPNMSFDPTTGRLQADPGHPLQRVVQNFVPPTEVLFNVTGISSEYKDFLRNNPEGAMRSLVSGLNIPIAFRTFNVPQEQFKAELRRDDAARAALQEALETGEDRRARQFPTIRPLLDQIRTLQAQGALGPFAPPAQQQRPGFATTVREALVP